MPTCHECFWCLKGKELNPQMETEIDFCRRYPPKVITVPRMNPISQDVLMEFRSVLPNILKTATCGEFKNKLMVSA